MTGGTLGGDGTFQIGGSSTFTWSGGTMHGNNLNGTTAVTSGSILDYTGSSNVTLSSARVLEIQNGGTFRLSTTTTTQVNNFNAVNQINVLAGGTIQRTTAIGANTTTLDAPIDNDGTVRFDAGAAGLLDLTGGTNGQTSTGAYGAPGGSKIRFNGDTHILGTGATIKGSVQIASGNVDVATGQTVAATGAGNTMTGGTLGGDGTFQIGGSSTFTWSGGTMNGNNLNGKTTVAGGAVLDYTGISNVTLSSARVLEIQNGGTFRLNTTTTTTVNDFNAVNQINVLAGGLIQRTTAIGANTTTLEAPIDNDGTIETRAGTLDLNDAALTNLSGSTLTGGRFAARNGVLKLPGNVSVQTNAAHLVLEGAAARISSDLAPDALAGMTLNAGGGILELDAGSNQTITGPFQNLGTLRFDLDGPAASSQGRLTVTGAATLGGTINGTTGFDPAVGTQFPVLTYGSRSGAFGAVTDNLAGKHFTATYGASGATLTVVGDAVAPPAATDRDGDKVLDPVDRCPTVAASTADGCPLPPPKLGRTANAVPLRGQVFVKLPGRSSAHAAQAKGRGFIPLSQARQIPMGSLLDTTRGAVRLTTSAASGSKTQSGSFDGGIFQVLQSRTRSKKGLTDLVLKGGSFGRCGKASTSANIARRSKRRIRRLRHNVKGKYRTRGRHSAATVRGTVYEVTDRCDGTLTKVTRGKVAVRDPRRRKTVVLRAGKSYLARAR